MPALILLLACIIPLEAVTRDHYTAVEVSHVYGLNGEYSFSQVYWLQWNKHTCDYDVVDFRILNENRRLLGNGRMLLYEDGGLRSVTADHYRESWEQHDPELSRSGGHRRKLRPIPARPRGLTEGGG